MNLSSSPGSMERQRNAARDPANLMPRSGAAPPSHSGAGSASSPGPFGELFLVGLDRRRLLQREADLVEAVEQAMLAGGVDVEMERAAVGAVDLLALEVDGQRGVRPALGVVEQLLQVFGRDRDRQDAVLEAVVVKNVGERGRDHAADAEVEQGPRRVLAARPAAEVVARD